MRHIGRIVIVSLAVRLGFTWCAQAKTHFGFDDRSLELSELFEVTVSSEEVARGKPAPDVYLETAHRLGLPPGRCAAIEDSASGIRAAHAAGMRVIAYPNRHYPPAADVLALADVVIESLSGLAVSVEA